RRLDRWGASTTYPLLLHLLEVRERNECTDDDVVECFAYVESFLVRRMIVGVPTNNLNRVFNSIIPQLDPAISLPEAVRRALSGERKYWPSDALLRDAIRSRPFYFQGRQDQKMLVFERLE